jgi:HEAT repeat protein
MLLLLVCAGSIFAAASRTPKVSTPGSSLYGVSAWIEDPAALGRESVAVDVRAGTTLVAHKLLHAYDPDFYLTVRAASADAIAIDAPQSVHREIVELPVSGSAPLRVLAPSRSPDDAPEFLAGQTVVASADERPYIAAPDQDAAAALRQGIQWYRVKLEAASPKLTYFSVETPDRDVPSDVDVFVRDAGGDLAAYREGNHAYVPEATQNFPGLFKFRARILHPGQTYFVRVSANHPAYRLRTVVFDPPPYRDARRAVETGMELLVQLGDAWLGNIPRRGAVALRTTLPHPEAQSCIACHPTQFTTRAYLTAVRNGYAVQNPVALDNLLTQLANNPRPLPGQPDTNWSRVIFSARTVSSRVPVLLDWGARYAGSDAVPQDLVNGAANYLRVDLGDTAVLPGDEADGASPAVSRFEIGLQTWQTFGLARGAEWTTRQQALERMLAAAPYSNTIDLNWKIIALATINRQSHRAEIHKLTEELLAWQQADGRFPSELKAGAPSADFITYHSLYALACAGLPASDPRVTRTVAYALRSQLAGGAWQGEPTLKAFNTPFRETQFAVMALSELFPQLQRPNPAGTSGALETGTLDNLLTDLENASTLDERAVRDVLRSSPWTLAREAAARRLARLGSEAAVPDLATALGDRSKLVQRSAAVALRRILSRGSDSQGLAQLAQALRSDSARQRWGALEVFSQRFREISRDPALLDAVAQALHDPAPANRLLAVNALSRWYPWQSDKPERRARILDSLCAATGGEKDERVLALLREAIYNVLDENLGYLEAWQRAMATDADRQKTTDAMHALMAEQARIVASHLKHGSEAQRRVLLEALWDLPVRHMAIPENNQNKVDVILPAFYAELANGVPRLQDGDYDYEPYRQAAAFRYSPANSFYRTRVGNDSDLIELSGAGPELEDALLEVLRSRDPEMQILAVKAASALGPALTPHFTEAILGLLDSGTPEVRAAIRYVFEGNARGALSLGPSDHPDPGVVKALVEALRKGSPDTLAVVLPLLSALPQGSAMTRVPELQWRVEAVLRDPPRPLLGQALRAAAVFPRVADGPLMRSVMMEALASADTAIALAAVEVVVKNYVTDLSMPELTKQYLHAAEGHTRRLLLDTLDPDRFALRLTSISAYNPGRAAGLPPDTNLFSSDLVIDFVAACLSDPNTAVRSAALDLIGQQDKLRQSDLIRAELARADWSETPRLAWLAKQLVDQRQQSNPAPEASALLDFQYFVRFVEPILAKPGSDGKACVMCHATHGIFPLRPPNGRAGFTHGQSEENYRFALRVVDVREPKKSLLLLKPTRPNDASGDANLYLSTHNGGERWSGNEASVEYETILNWIRGARVGEGKQVARK